MLARSQLYLSTKNKFTFCFLLISEEMLHHFHFAKQFSYLFSLKLKCSYIKAVNINSKYFPIHLFGIIGFVAFFAPFLNLTVRVINQELKKSKQMNVEN